MWKHTLMDDTIQNLSISNSGYIHCRSQYYTAFNTLYENNVYRINHGLNELIGDIDCGTWAISYLLSMFDSVDKTTLFKPLIAYVNGGEMDLKTLQHYSCYMDISYPMFSSECTIKDIVVSAIDISRIQTTAANIREMFLINS